jgi:hypothetical protein
MPSIDKQRAKAMQPSHTAAHITIHSPKTQQGNVNVLLLLLAAAGI